MELTKIQGLLEGWRNKIAPREELKDLIDQVYKDRLTHCNTCPEDSENKKKTGWTTLRIDRHCGNCGCTTEPKLKCLSCSCPLSKWQAITTQQIEDEIKKNSK